VLIGIYEVTTTEAVHITEAKGISLISDIDDIIKHSAIANGAKEIFTNTFIRELQDLTIQGVKEWYTKLYSLGVKLHYVSNSPWQISSIKKLLLSRRSSTRILSPEALFGDAARHF
jgi:phosphatidate phosphatase APP1